MSFEYKLVFSSIVPTVESPVALFTLQLNQEDIRADLLAVDLALTVNDTPYVDINYALNYTGNQTVVLISIIPNGIDDLRNQNFKWFLNGTFKVVGTACTVNVEAGGVYVPSKETDE